MKYSLFTLFAAVAVFARADDVNLPRRDIKIQQTGNQIYELFTGSHLKEKLNRRTGKPVTEGEFDLARQRYRERLKRIGKPISEMTEAEIVWLFTHDGGLAPAKIEAKYGKPTRITVTKTGEIWAWERNDLTVEVNFCVRNPTELIELVPQTLWWSKQVKE